MADAFFDKGMQSFGKAEIDLLGDDIVLLLADSTFVRNLSTNQFISDVGAAELSGSRSDPFSGKMLTGNGVFDADDVVLAAVPSGGPATQIVIAKDTGTDSTSRLICVLDSYTGLPITTNGGDVNVVFPGDAKKIFEL